MKAWWVWTEGAGGVFVRADTRGKAKAFHPDYTPHLLYGEFFDFKAVRAAWLDGDGPARELDAVYKRCDHEIPDDQWEWGCEICFEGCYVDQEATIRANHCPHDPDERWSEADGPRRAMRRGAETEGMAA